MNKKLLKKTLPSNKLPHQVDRFLRLCYLKAENKEKICFANEFEIAPAQFYHTDFSRLEMELQVGTMKYLI